VSRVCGYIFNFRPEGRTTRGWLSEAKSGFTVRLFPGDAKFPRATVDPGLGQPAILCSVAGQVSNSIRVYIPMSPARMFRMLAIFNILVQLSTAKFASESVLILTFSIEGQWALWVE
jgi:hypothetical protein